MDYVFYAMLFVVGYHTYRRLIPIRKFERFHRNTRTKWGYFLIKLRAGGKKSLLPFWVYRYGSGPLPVWSWRMLEAATLLSPFWALSFAGIQVRWDYPVSFVIGLLFSEAVVDWRWSRFLSEKVVEPLMREEAQRRQSKDCGPALYRRVR